jgi:glucokinase
MKVLAGDIGGTHARLALVDSGGPRREVLERRSYDSRDYPALEPIVADFLERIDAQPEAACLGVACPIVHGLCEMSNLTWEIDVDTFGEHVGLPELRFINDFDAVGWAIGELEGDEDLVTLREGEAKEHGPIALIGAGTGLGSGFLTWSAGRYLVHSSEGGHVDFAPRTPTEVELYAHLAARFPRVSYERIVSGPGLVNVYEFIVETGRAAESPEVREAMDAEDGDPARTISTSALAGEAPACVQALDLFCSVFGAQAGNLALTVKATGGVYIAGGIAPAILDKLRDGTFERAFLDKGRVAEVVEAAPLRVVVRRDVGLLGASVAAETLSSR